MSKGEEKTTLQIKFPSGDTVKILVKETSDLTVVADMCLKYATEQGLTEKKGGKIYQSRGYTFSCTYPKIDFDIEQNKGKSIKELGLLRASLLISPKTDSELKLSHEPFNKPVFGDPNGSDLKLKSEDREDRERYEKKMREKEQKEKEKEREEKKKAIEKVRTRIQGDHENRKEMFKNNSTNDFEDIKD